MRLELVWIGKTKNPELGCLEREYVRRISRYFDVRRMIVAEQRRTAIHQQAAAEEKEARLIEGRLTSGSFLIVLEENGKQLTSLELAEFMRSLRGRGVRSATFLVGGFAGIPDRIRGKADLILSLSSMTFTHEMARVILLEQIYRATTILQGTPYHK